MTQILVTGGSGFVGRALCADLVRAGHAVTVLTRSPPLARRVLPDEVTLVSSLADAGTPEAVVNLQGENLTSGRWTPTRKDAFVNSRVTFTRGLVSWMERTGAPPAVLVNASAIGWYGDAGDDVLTEDSKSGEDFAARLCRKWEVEAERATWQKVRVCRVRFGIVFEPSGGALARMLPAFRMGAGGRMGTGAHWMSWIARHDLVRLLRFLVETPGLSGTFNATSPHPVTNEEFAHTLGQVLGRPPRLPLPAWALRLAFGEMAELLLVSQRVLPKRALAAGFRFEQPELETALAEMLAEPVGHTGVDSGPRSGP